MKNTVAILEKPGKMVIKEAAVPEPKDNEVLIKVGDVGICGSDVHGFQHGPYIPPKDPNQTIGLGHEVAGIVEKIGANVTDFKVGDRVCIEPGIPCYKCEFCMEGHYNVCPDVDFMATQPNYKGALTNYLTHPADMTYHLPDNMSIVEGALVEPAAVGIHAAEMAGELLGKKVVILGSGCIGLMTVQSTKLMGASEIVVIDVLQNRLDKAKELGATAIFDGRDEDLIEKVKEVVGEYGADVVFETAGAIPTAKMALQLVKRRGKVMIVGTIPGDTPIDFLKINREVSIQTVFRYANDYPKTISMISKGDFDVLSMADKYFDYENTQEAFEFSVNNKSDLIKGVIRVAKLD
ncbi:MULTISPECIES: NAD(P)-dependent alcohol dehydrogenase [Enterococcus]|uniref:NAD(P)-dependent alcohol dehydrogenase n=1 Tax=Enterococcus TaxID=1350 RepID=UPI000E5D8F8D|nr:MULTISPECIES: NAD(P)-dependent alcohol dehydrogenase [Enterococcus]RGW62453.1 NAD(P)-dependent alcohol dehydrogenase [Enterococcus durans]